MNKTKLRMLSLLLAAVMTFCMLPIQHASAEVSGNEIIVYTETQFRAALKDATYTTIYLGADITMTASTQTPIAKRTGGTLTINGTSPETGKKHTYTDYGTSAQSYVGLSMASGAVTDTVIFKDINFYIKNYYGVMYVGGSTKHTVIFDNVSGDAAQYAYMFYATLIIRNSVLNVKYLGASPSQELAEVSSIIFEGKVEINHNSSVSTGYAVINFNSSSSEGTVKFRENSDVTIKTANAAYGCFIYNYSVNRTVELEKNAKFTFYGVDRFSQNAAVGRIATFTIGEGAAVTLIMPQNNTQGLSPIGLYADTVNVGKGASLFIYGNMPSGTSYASLYTKQLNLTNPRRVVVYNGGSSGAVSSGTTYYSSINATGIKSIRYYSTVTGSYDFTTYKYNDGRSDWTRSFIKEEGSFYVQADKWGQTAPSGISTDYPGGFSAANISAVNQKVIQIDGSYTSPPSVNSVVEGTTAVTGTGIPGSVINVSSLSAGELTTTVGDDGTWAVNSDNPFVRDEIITVTQTESLYGSPCDTSEPVTTIALSKTVRLIPENNITKKYGTDSLRVGVNKGGASAFDVTKVEYIIFNNPDEVFDPEDTGAFDIAFASVAANQAGRRGSVPVSASAGGAADYLGSIGTIQYNCAVWVRATLVIDGKTVEALDSISYRNLYTKYPVQVRGMIAGDSDDILYHYETVEGDYGIPYMGDGVSVYGNPIGGFDTVAIKIKESLKNHWTAKLGGENTPYYLTFDEDFLTNTLCDNSDPAKYTLYCTKIPEMWWENVTVYFRDSTGAAVIINDSSAGTMSVPLDAENGNASTSFYELGGRYIPPSEGNNQPVGWFVAVGFDVSLIEELDDFNSSGFSPVFSDVKSENLFVVYETGRFTVTEQYNKADGSLIEVSKHTSFKTTDTGEFTGTIKRVGGYVPVSYTISGASDAEVNGTYPFVFDPAGALPTENQYSLFAPPEIDISLLSPGPVTVTYTYVEDKNNNGIPDSEEASVTVRWYGYALGSEYPVPVRDSAVILGRSGYELTVANTYTAANPTAPEDPSHRIESSGTYWIFDLSAENPAAKPVELGKAGDGEIIFKYSISTDGVNPDKEQYVEVSYYAVTSDNDAGSPIEGRDTTKTYILKGNKYSLTPPAISGYVYYGYRLDSDDGDNNAITYVNGQSSVPVEFTTGYNGGLNHPLTLLYREAAAPATVNWTGVTWGGSLSVGLGSETLRGFVGERLRVNASDIQVEDGWVLTNADDYFDIVLSSQSQTYEFKYKETDNTAVITVIYESTDGVFSMQQQITLTKNDAEFAYKPWTIPTYEAISASVVSNYDGRDLGGGLVNGSIMIDPSNGHQTVTVTFETTSTSVIIKAINSEDESVLFSRTVTDVTIGSVYAAFAPYISGCALVSEEPMIKSVTVNRGANIIEYNYYSIGEYTINCYEDDGTLIRQFGGESGETVERAPDLSGDYFTYNSADSRNSTDLDFSSDNKTISFYYTKDMADVLVTAIDKADDSELESKELSGAARKGEMFTAAADFNILSYSLSDAVSKTVYTDPEAYPVAVAFYYEEDETGDISIISYYMENGSRVELGNISGRGVVGSKFTAAAGQFPGFELIGSGEVEITVSADSSKNVIEFKYEDIRKTVSVYTQIEDNTATKEMVSEYKYESGGEVTLLPPYKGGYLVVGYIIDGEEMVEVDPKGFGSLDLGEITDNIGVVFVYRSIEEVVDAGYVTVKIKGVSGSLELYSYIKRIPKSGESITLTAGAEVFTVPGYLLDEGQDFTIKADGSVTEKTFTYTSTAATVKINTVDDSSGTPVGPGSFNVGATAGKPFNYYAPHVEGYRLVGDAIGIASSVAADGGSVIEFRYAKIVSQVTIVCKEEGTDRIIRVVEIENPEQAGAAIAAPDLSSDFYTAVKGGEELEYNWNGTDSLKIEAFYTKDMVDIPIIAKNLTSGEEIGTDTLTGQRKGEVAEVGAPTITNYIVIGSETKLVIADESEVVFYYVSILPYSVTVCVYSDPVSDGNLLMTYAIPAAQGAEVTINPNDIYIAGYAYDSESADNNLSATAGEDEVIIVIMKDVRLTLTVKTKLGSGSAQVNGAEKVISGMDRTVYPPYVHGWVVTGYILDSNEETPIPAGFTGVELTTITANHSVTFVYTAIEDVVSEYTVKIYISGEDTDGVNLYDDEMVIAKNTGAVRVTAHNIPGYALDDATVDGTNLGDGTGTIYVDVYDEDIEVVFIYRSLETEVTIRLFDSEDEISSFTADAVAGQPFTYNAPDLYRQTGIYYYFVRQESDNTDPESSTGRIDEVKGDGSSEICFYYKQVIGDVIIAAREDNTSGRMILFRQADDQDWRHGETFELTAPDLSNDYYSYTGYDGDPYDDSGAVEFEYDQNQMPLIIELYYEKETMDIPVTAKDTNGQVLATGVYNGARMGETVYIEAPEVPGYKADRNIMSVTALPGAEVEFYYTIEREEAQDGSITVFVTASDTGRAISGANVTISDAAGAAVFTGKTDRNGEAEYSAAAFGTYNIKVTASGYRTGRAAVTIDGQRPDRYAYISLVTAVNSGSSGSGSSGGSKTNEEKETPDRVSEAGQEVGKEAGAHVCYITGYSDGTVKPDGMITRAETAMIFYRIMTGGNVTGLKSTFSDVAEDAWYAQAAAYLEACDILSGYPDGTFRPDAYITRAEFTAIAIRYFGASGGSAWFSDVDDDHWAAQNISSAAVEGWVTGYPDGSFRPQSYITRAEAVTIINRVMGRRVLTADIPAGAARYTDLDVSHWAYAAIAEASVSHSYSVKADGYESWVNR